jgi:hypothetical protein
MVIEEPDFRMTSSTNNLPFWDLELLYIVKPKNGEPRKEFKIAGYGLSFEGAIRKIVNFRIACKFPKSALTLKQYLKEYKEEVNKINELTRVSTQSK